MKHILIIIILSICSLSNSYAQHNTHATTHAKVTCYQPTKAQCSGNPLQTADGSVINLDKLKTGKIRWCAVSHDIWHLFPKDKPKRIRIEGCPPLNGIWEVRDKTNRRLHHTVDILIHPRDKARYAFRNVKIHILK